MNYYSHVQCVWFYWGTQAKTWLDFNIIIMYSLEI